MPALDAEPPRLTHKGPRKLVVIEGAAALRAAPSIARATRSGGLHGYKGYEAMRASFDLGRGRSPQPFR